jgi:hypothetical protein
VVLAAGVFGLANASAQTRTIWSASVPVEIEYDSNPNMLPGNGPSTTFVRVTPNASGAYVYGGDQFKFEGSLTAEKSSDTRAAKDRLDPRVRASWRRDDPLGTMELAALVERQAIRALDVGEHAPVGSDGSRSLFALTAALQRDRDERTSWSADLRQEWARYSDAPSPDYRRTAASARVNRQQDENRTWYAGVNGQDYRADAATSPVPLAPSAAHTGVAGALVGIVQSFGPAWRVEANAGPVRFTQGASRSDWQAYATAQYKAERWLASVEVSRAPGVDPTFGGLLVTNDAHARLRWDLDALSHFDFAAAMSSESAGGRTERAMASAAWSRQLSPFWQLAVRASLHRWESFGTTARATRIGAQLTYTKPDL